MMHLQVKKVIASMAADGASGASEEVIAQLVSESGLQLPQQYLGFLRESNGAEGWAGENAYLQLWKAEELLEHNRGYCVGEFMPGAFLFGSSGGGMAYAFDTRSDPMKIVEVPWEVLRWEEVWDSWESFADFLLGLSKRGPDD